MPHVATGPHLATSGHCEPRGILPGSGKGYLPFRVQGGGLSTLLVLNVPSVHRAQSIAVGPGHIHRTAAPCAEPGSRQLSWAWEALDADTAMLVAGARASWAEHRGPHPVPCVWGPDSVLGLGGVVRATGVQAAGGSAEAHLQGLPPCPALSCSCARSI